MATKNNKPFSLSATNTEAVTATIEKVSSRVYLVTGGQNHAVVQFTRGDDASFEPSGSTLGAAATVGDGLNARKILYQPNGVKNDMPQAREKLILDNTVIGPLMETKRDLLIGLGLIPTVKKFVGGKTVISEVEMPREAEVFFEAINMDAFLRDAFGELVMHGMFLPEAVREKSGKIIDIGVKKSRHMRSGLKDDSGKVGNWYWCGNWLRKSSKQFPVKEIPVYNPSLERLDGWKRQGKFVMPIGCSLLTDDYYNIPIWQGSRTWAELANLIAPFHLYNLENGFVPRWHITIPQDYFKGVTPKGLTAAQLTDADTKEEAARQEFLNTLNKYLAGLPGVGRALVTDEYWDALAKQYVGIKITSLNVDIKDESMLKLNAEALKMTIAAQSIHPTLGSVETGETRAGGSEILRALQIYLMTRTKQPRSAVLQFINFLHRVNDWGEGIKWQFKDETLTTLGETKDGTKEKVPN